MWIVQCSWITGGPLVMMWLDVGRTAGQQQSVKTRQQGIDVECLTQRRDQHRHSVPRLGDRHDVLLPHRVKPVIAEQATIGWYPDEGLCCTHVNYFKQPA